MTNEEKGTVTARFKALRDRYRIRTSAAFAVLATLAIITGEIFPKVNEFIFRSGVLQYVTFLVVLDISVSIYLHQLPPVTRISKNQDESMPQLIESVPHCQTDGVDLLEYAGATILPLIRAVQRAHVPMRLLVKHPDTISGLQKQRMIITLDTLFNSIFDGYTGKFEIRCYRAPYTLRGRRLGSEFLEIGWLTPDLKHDTAYGHSNPSLIADLTTKTNRYLTEFFERTFNDLWNADDTENAFEVLNRLKPEVSGSLTGT